MKMLVSLQVMGIVGCTIYVSILLFSLYQLLLFCSPFRWNFFSTRKMFHILLLIYCILQILSVQNFLQDKFFGKWTFTSHLFAVCAEICAVSMVAVLWSKTLVSSNTAYRKIVPLLVVVDGFFIGYTIMVCADMDASSSSFTRWTESSVFFRYMLLLEPIALVVNGFCLAYLGIRIRSRLIRDPSWEKLPAQQKRMVLFRLIGTMVVCCTCFLLRASLLLWLFVQGDVVISEKPSWILSTWVPSLLPVCVLTYTMVSSFMKLLLFLSLSGLLFSELLCLISCLLFIIYYFLLFLFRGGLRLMMRRRLAQRAVSRAAAPAVTARVDACLLLPMLWPVL